MSARPRFGKPPFSKFFDRFFAWLDKKPELAVKKEEKFMQEEKTVAEKDSMSIISKGTSLEGKCVRAEGLRVEGSIIGEVHATEIQIVSGGMINGNVFCTKLLVADGGKLTSESVKTTDFKVGKGGIVNANVETASISIEEGNVVEKLTVVIMDQAARNSAAIKAH